MNLPSRHATLRYPITVVVVGDKIGGGEDETVTAFYPAEDYHQDYARLNPDQPYIQAVSTPKACKVREKYSGLVRKSAS